MIRTLKFLVAAATLSVVGTGTVLSSSASAASTTTGKSAKSAAGAKPGAKCPFTLAEVSTAIGATYTKQDVQATPFAGGSTLHCAIRDNDFRAPIIDVMVTTWSTKKDFDQQEPQLVKFLAGKLQPIKGDPDKAFWQVDQGDLTATSLNYVHGLSLVNVRLSAKGYEAKVLKLRRIG